MDPQDDKAEQAAKRKAINEVRKLIVQRTETTGNTALEMRRKRGLPDPDGEEWGKRIMLYEYGIVWLYLASKEPGFSLDSISGQLREYLRDPVTDQLPGPMDLARLILSEALTQPWDQDEPSR